MLVRRDQAFLHDIETVIRRFDAAKMQRLTNGFAVEASGTDGFDMAVLVENGHFILCFGNWSEDFESDEVARRLFEAALDGKARLKIDSLGGQPWRWTLERLDDSGRWSPESTMAHMTWRFWGRASTIYLSNSFSSKQPKTTQAG
jgi:hypothetical protein